jgi:NitT/TauT family transport system substrate-binding protein
MLVCLLLSLSACDFIAGLAETSKPIFQSESDDGIESQPLTQLTFAVAPLIAWMPWYLADQEGIFQNQELINKYNVKVQFISDNYQDTIDQFLAEEVQAIAITNIDAIAKVVRHNIEADVILITNEHNGNEGVILPGAADMSLHNLRGKTFALVQYSARHYLLDRYLIRNQIAFDEINIQNTAEAYIPKAFLSNEVYGVVTHGANLYRLTHTASTKTLFDSYQIPKEIFDLLIVRRDTLNDYPGFAQVLLTTWFSIMKRLQGNKKGPTLDAMASLANLSRQAYEEQITTTPFNDTSVKALSAIRDRRIRKTMRHIRYFVQRHELVSPDAFTDLVSYPGRTKALLHFNGQPLQDFVAPPAKK